MERKEDNTLRTICIIGLFISSALLASSLFSTWLILSSNQYIDITVREVSADQSLADVARNVSGQCQSKGCIFAAIEYFVIEKVPYLPDGEGALSVISGNDPWTTLERGGDCENKAILALSLLKSLGETDLYLVFERDHACWLGKPHGYYQFYGCNGGELMEVRKVA